MASACNRCFRENSLSLTTDLYSPSMFLEFMDEYQGEYSISELCFCSLCSSCAQVEICQICGCCTDALKILMEI